MSVIKNVWGPNHTIVVILSASKMMTSYSACPKKTGILVDKADAITPLKSEKERLVCFFGKFSSILSKLVEKRLIKINIFLRHFSTNLTIFGAYPAALMLNFLKHTNFFLFDGWMDFRGVMAMSTRIPVYWDTLYEQKMMDQNIHETFL